MMLPLAVAACGPAAPAPSSAVAEAAAEPAPESPPGHGDELLPGLAGIGRGRAVPQRERLATDREGMLRAGRAALDDGRPGEALSITEVLLLVHGAEDPEARELRGRCLEALGDEPAAREEFSACCAAGRDACCAAGAER